MKSLVLIVLLVISSSSSYHNHHDHNCHDHSGPDEDDIVIYPPGPWWHPNKPGRGFDPGPRPHWGRDGSDGMDSMGPPGSGPWGRPTTNKPTRITYPIYPPTSRSTTTESTESSSTTSSGLNFVIETCRATCLVTNEHNPVCGTDNVTYSNIGKLECARNCGVDVQLKRKSPCGQRPFTPTLAPDHGGKGDGNGSVDNAVIQACMRNCPVTSEYNPICGSDNVTYANPGRLQCAIDCGARVQVSRQTSCSVPTGHVDATQACISTCTVTAEYNPVCGTNNVTYHNAGLLECAQNCGLDVQLSRRSLCSIPPGPDNPEFHITTKKPNGNGNGGSGNNGGNGNNGNGNSGNGGNGDNGGNRNNDNGNNDNGNNGNGNNGNGNNGNGGNGNNGGKDNGNNGGKGNGNGKGNQSMTEIVACMQLCPITPEMNPVCGTDGVTYTNPGRLLCSQFCGIDVRVQKFAPCLGEPIPNPHQYVCPTLPTPTDMNPPTTADCIKSCTVSQEFNPVCGSDGVTYLDLASLQCKMKCGVDVSIQKLSACDQTSQTDTPTAQTPPVWGNTDRPTQPTVATPPTPMPTPGNVIQICINNCFTTPDYKPVCGTNGETYANLEKLQCAKRCGINVDVKSMNPCESPMIDGQKNENTTEDNGLGFTIPPDVLASIFPEYNTPTPQPDRGDDSDETFDIDKRFGDH